MANENNSGKWYDKVKEWGAGVKEWWDPFDPDAGIYIGDAPCAKNNELVKQTVENKEQCHNVNKVDDSKLLVKGAGIVGGGLLGYKLGENFGTAGKLIGCAVFAGLGCKFSRELATDVAAAADYVKQNSKDGTDSKKNLLQATFANLANLDGQVYTGKTVDADPDITD